MASASKAAKSSDFNFERQAQALQQTLRTLARRVGAGPPGVGKTLTAEMYAEVTGRPLYRVHSGQLGLSVAAMEAALKDALTRAQRWGAVMLIDEADVYIRQRIDDIAEAIISRCIALIRYHPPDQAPPPARAQPA